MATITVKQFVMLLYFIKITLLSFLILIIAFIVVVVVKFKMFKNIIFNTKPSL